MGTTLKTLILKTNPFLVRTNEFTADLAFVGKTEKLEPELGPYITLPLTALKCLPAVLWFCIKVGKNQTDKGKLGQLSVIVSNFCSFLKVK